MAGFDADAGRYFVFLAITFCMNLYVHSLCTWQLRIAVSGNSAMSVWFRMLAYVAPRQETAEMMAAPSTAICMIFGGFMIAKSTL